MSLYPKQGGPKMAFNRTFDFAEDRALSEIREQIKNAKAEYEAVDIAYRKALAEVHRLGEERTKKYQKMRELQARYSYPTD